MIWELGYFRSAGSGGAGTRHAVDPAAAESDVTAELEWLRRGERDPFSPGADILEEGHRFFAWSGKSMRFALIDGGEADFVRSPLLAFGISQRLFCLRGRLACHRQRDDMLAHVRSARRRRTVPMAVPGMTGTGYRPSGRSSPDRPADARQRPAGSAEAGSSGSTDSHHAWLVAPNLLDQDFTATGPDKKWGADISTWTREGWLHSRLSSTCSLVGSLLGNRRPVARDLAPSALQQIPDHASSGSRAGPPSTVAASIARSIIRPSCASTAS